MKTIAILLTLCAVPATLFPQNLPSKTNIINTLEKVSNAWMEKNPETESINSSGAEWLEGTYFAGHMALFELFPSKKNINYALLWGKNNDWKLGTKPKEADNQCVGQTYMDIFSAYGSKDDYMLSKIDNSVQDLVNRLASDDWHWIDALFMAMPVLTRYGNYFNRDSYLDKLYSLFHHTKVTLQLYDEADGLWYRDANFKPPFKTPGGKKCYWSRGNGWVFGGLASTLKYLPEDNSHRQEYIDVFKSMAKALQKVQRDDGFWNVSLADTIDFPGPETSGTAFFTYGIAWGINEGILDSAFYMPTVTKAWNGMVSKAVHPDGRVGYTQGVSDKPSRSQPVTYNSFRDYGEGSFLLAGTEVIKLAPGDMPLPNDFYVRSVELVKPNVLKVTFYEEAEKRSAENTSNYTVNKGVEVLKAEISDDKLSSLLTLSSITEDYYGIYFQNIISTSGKTIGPGNGKQFKGTINTSSSSN